ncbi:hypothetical protein Glove_198g92 [Diversispora epigaea]|uniref:BTB domain-containing protein n=1 Tax=Diversispora epigaea TaxID=1348612 RepID=A0A397IRI3_9GLOM|nr:hypothetical protein Glove_198g92 [Diversispora epigaea]
MTFKFFDKLSQDFSELLNDKKDYNVVIEVDKEGNKKSFTAHSVVLRYRSPYFDKELENATTNKNHIKTVIKPNISSQIFEIILKYIYGGIVDIGNADTKTIYKLMFNANELDLEELSVKLESYLIESKASWLRTHFSLIYYSIFDSNEFKGLKRFYNDIIAKHPNLIFESRDFTSLQEAALISILKRDDLKVEEIKIWDYVIKWGIAQNSTLPANSKEWSNENFEALKITLQHCLPLIRYFHISSDDIWEKVKLYEKILEKQLWDDIIQHHIFPNKPIKSLVLPARIISNPGLPSTVNESFSTVINKEHVAKLSSDISNMNIHNSHPLNSDSQGYYLQSQRLYDPAMEDNCKEMMERYTKDHRSDLGFETPNICTAGYHCCYGDDKGLVYHLGYKGDRITANYNFSGSIEPLVLLTIKNCSVNKMLPIFQSLEEGNADFKIVSNTTGKNVFHYLWENSMITTKGINEKSGTDKFIKNLDKIIEFLVDKECDINALDKDHRTILSYILTEQYSQNDFIPIIELLFKHGANPNVPTHLKAPQKFHAPSALFLAIKFYWPIEVLDLLYDNNANGDLTNEDDHNLLMLTVIEEKKQPEAMRWVLNHIPSASDSKSRKAASKHIRHMAMTYKDVKQDNGRGEARRVLSEWRGSSGKSNRNLVLENMQLKKEMKKNGDSSSKSKFKKVEKHNKTSDEDEG